MTNHHLNVARVMPEPKVTVVSKDQKDPRDPEELQESLENLGFLLLKPPRELLDPVGLLEDLEKLDFLDQPELKDQRVNKEQL